NLQRQNNQSNEKRQQHQDPQKSPLFGEYRKNKVGVSLRQKFELTLCPAVQALSQELPRPNGDARLQRMVPLSAGIIGGINEGHDPLLLVVVERSPHHLPRERKQHERKEQYNAQGLGPHPHHQQHRGVNRQKTQAAAKIRLFEDQEETRHHDQARQHDPLHPPLAGSPGIVA